MSINLNMYNIFCFKYVYKHMYKIFIIQNLWRGEIKSKFQKIMQNI